MLNLKAIHNELQRETHRNLIVDTSLSLPSMVPTYKATHHQHTRKITLGRYRSLTPTLLRFHQTANGKNILLSSDGIFSDGYYLLIYSPPLLTDGDPTPLHIQAEVTMKTNFFGTRAVCTELLPLMKPQGKPHQGPKLCCFWHDLPLPLCPMYTLRPLSLLSHTSLIAVSSPGQVPLCLRTLTHSSCSHQCPPNT